ncbi:MAG: hypothetical protein JRJ06_04470, partial [Deltaproteobacteria bacterium]|nr:hypothetical protein [Deltaproteobacteria bacterium]
MTNAAASITLPRRIMRWLLWLSLMVLFLIALLAVVLSLLPSLVSTEYFRHQLEKRAFQILQRPVHVEQLSWSWSAGILLKGLKVSDDSFFSSRPLVSLDRVLLTVDFRQFLRRRLVFDLELEGLDFSLIRNPEGQTNVELLLARPGTPGREKVDLGKREPRIIPLAVPLDVSGRVRIGDVSVQVHDRMHDRVLSIHDISFLLEFPSILSEPVTMVLSMKEEMDGKPLPPVEITARVEKLVDSKGSLRLDTAAVEIQGSIPGARFDINGNGREPALNGNVQMELATLLTAAQPFISATLPELSGRIELDAEVTGDLN